VVTKEGFRQCSVKVPTKPVTPENAGNQCWQHDSGENGYGQIVLVLELNDRIFVKILHIGNLPEVPWILPHDHPAQV